LPELAPEAAAAFRWPFCWSRDDVVWDLVVFLALVVVGLVVLNLLARRR
jgi:hypothetical protein